MSDKVNIEYNFNNIINSIEKMGEDIDKIEAKATLKGANILKKALQRNIPKSYIDHKHLRDNVKVGSYKEDEDGNRARVINFGKLQFKIKWLEFGTSKMKPLFVLTKSLKETKNNILQAINDELAKVIHKK